MRLHNVRLKAFEKHQPEQGDGGSDSTRDKHAGTKGHPKTGYQPTIYRFTLTQHTKRIGRELTSVISDLPGIKKISFE